MNALVIVCGHTVLRIPIKPALGHQARRSGAGVHADKRTKRKKTRSSVQRMVNERVLD